MRKKLWKLVKPPQGRDRETRPIHGAILRTHPSLGYDRLNEIQLCNQLIWLRNNNLYQKSIISSSSRFASPPLIFVTPLHSSSLQLFGNKIPEFSSLYLYKIYRPVSFHRPNLIQKIQNPESKINELRSIFNAKRGKKRKKRKKKEGKRKNQWTG